MAYLIIGKDVFAVFVRWKEVSQPYETFRPNGRASYESCSYEATPFAT